MNNNQNPYASRKTSKHIMADMVAGLNNSDAIIKETKEKGVGNHRLQALETLLKNK